MGLECREMVRIESPARVGNRKMETEARTKGKVRGADPHQRLTHTCLGTSRSLQWSHGRWWPAAGLGALSVAVRAWDLLKEVTITSTIVEKKVKMCCSVASDS